VGATKGHFAGATMVESTKKLFPIYSDTQMLDINDPFDEIIKSLNTFQPNILTGYAFALKKLAEAKNRGELKDCTLITNLFNKTLPLIRYKSSDILAKIEDSQNYYPFVKIENVVGRREMSPIFVNDLGQEDFISPHLIVEIFVEGLNAFQVVLESDRSFSFKVQYDKNITNSEKMICQEELKNRLQSILDQKKMTNVKFEIQEVEKLWVDSKTGKFKLILKNY
jgi:phenylacetate-coenzyme A ligase PaaK-like adenylate-forming protein